MVAFVPAIGHLVVYWHVFQGETQEMKRQLNQNSTQYVFFHLRVYESGKEDGTMANQNMHLDDNYYNFCFRCSIPISISDLHYKIKLP